MHPILKNVLAIVAGLVIGAVVNMSIVMLSGSIIPPPEGADVTTTEGLRASIHLFKPINFLMPFLAHAIGTLVGAFVAAKFAANNKMIIALAIAVFFLAGGVSMVFMVPSPMWFNVIDLVGAYLPMGYLSGKLCTSKR